jgi:hypothetical protein
MGEKWKRGKKNRKYVGSQGLENPEAFYVY